MIALSLRRVPLSAPWLLWSYLAIVTIAELITALISPQLGLVLHTLLLIGLITHAALLPDDGAAKIALALTLAPLIRLLSLSMPLLSFPQMAWYPIVSIPLLIAMWIIVRQLGVARRSLGLQRGNIALQLMLVGGGVGLGWIEYVILQPGALIPGLSLEALVWPVLSLVIFTGFTEEVIFRGLLQTLSRPVLGRWAFTYVALLFAVLHIGYVSVTDVVFVFAVGFVFAYIVHWSGSILGVTLAHGLTNVTLFLIMPYLIQHPDHPVAVAAPWIAGSATAVALLAVAIIARSALHRDSTPTIHSGVESDPSAIDHVGTA